VTWSIVAVDPVTREVGVGAATCTVGVELVRGVVPGRGVLAAQASTNLHARNQAVAALRDGLGLEEVLAVAERASGRFGLSAWKDQQFAVAVLDPEPRARAHTGSDTVAWAGSRGAQAVSVQGNMLRGAEVVDVTLAAFASEDLADGRPPDLAERIVRGLEAGASVGGDNRCPFDCPALTAFVAVARPDEDPDEDPDLYLVAPRAFGLKGALRHSMIPYQPGPDDPSPITALRAMLDAKRRVG
jgi:uncharacterized Ntn-hydrolase superfamily protein